MTAKQVQIRRDSATNLNGATPADGELGYDTTNDELRIGDGVTAGGIHIPNSKMIQAQSYIAANAGGTADALTLTVSPVPAAYASFQRFVFKATATNATTTPTINVNTLGAKTIKKKSSSGKVAVAVGDIQNGCIYAVQYDGTDMQLESVDIVPNTASGQLLAETYYTCPTKVVTMTIASPGVINVGTNNERYLPPNNAPIRLTTTGALPTGLATGTTYYVVNSGVDGTTKFRLAATKGGADINTSGSQSGTHTIASAPFIKATNNPTFIVVSLVGGGGVGQLNGGGGGSGGYATAKILASLLASSESMIVGEGGTGAGVGSSFGAFLSVGGGAQGSGSTSFIGGAGGTRDTGAYADFTTEGQDGGVGNAAAGHGNGGGTIFGGSGQGSGAGGKNHVGYSGCIKISEYS